MLLYLNEIHIVQRPEAHPVNQLSLVRPPLMKDFQHLVITHYETPRNLTVP